MSNRLIHLLPGCLHWCSLTRHYYFQSRNSCIVQRQTAVTAYLKSKQLLLFVFAVHNVLERATLRDSPVFDGFSYVWLFCNSSSLCNHYYGFQSFRTSFTDRMPFYDNFVTVFIIRVLELSCVTHFFLFIFIWFIIAMYMYIIQHTNI